MYHVNVNVILMEKSVIQIKIRIKINVECKKHIYMKKIICGILLHVVVKMLNI